MKEAIAIIGGGQSGLQLAIALKRKNFNVTLYTNRSAEQIFSGNILSNQAMFSSALSIERSLGVDCWQEHAPQNNVVTFTLARPNKPIIDTYWQGKTHSPYQSVDQRLKFSQWMHIFEEEGGKLVILDVSIDNLDHIAKKHDLTIISAGKGEICQLFPTNKKESPFKTPQRALSCFYVNKVSTEHPGGVRGSIIPGTGEFFISPGLSHNGPCEMILFEGIINGPFDCWHNIKDIHEQLHITLKLLEKFAPWEAIRLKNAEPTDEKASLIGSYMPLIREPIAQLHCGKFILGMGDAIVLNDPIGGQGANNACRAAQIYAESICENSGKIFDVTWMKKTFQLFWDNHGKWATRWSNLLLTPPSSHMIELFKAASQSPAIANILSNAFDEPASLFPWIENPEEIRRLINDIEGTYNK